MDASPARDLLCLSHLRWNFVFQRPNHLMTRAARSRRVFFVEEPVAGDSDDLVIEVRDGVSVVTPTLATSDPGAPDERLAALMNRLVAEHEIERPVLWYATPMPLAWTRHLERSCVVYDCMDQLSEFDGAPPELLGREAELLGEADVVFTGGRSLYESKRSMHPSVHAMPSAVDVRHFWRAREDLDEPVDQAAFGRPRIGWFGVIDERMDLDLVDGIAAARPDWAVVLVGPVAKIDPTALPRRPNIHWLGPRSYADLPRYLRGWDVAIMPFARNRATRYISPTKTPEYLAGGKPVVSTSIADVVHPYGEQGLVRVADTAEAFVAACEAALVEEPSARIRAADAFLARISWDETWRRMDGLIREASRARASDRRIGVTADLPRAASARATLGAARATVVTPTTAE